MVAPSRVLAPRHFITYVCGELQPCAAHPAPGADSPLARLRLALAQLLAANELPPGGTEGRHAVLGRLGGYPQIYTHPQAGRQAGSSTSADRGARRGGCTRVRQPSTAAKPPFPPRVMPPLPRCTRHPGPLQWQAPCNARACAGPACGQRGAGAPVAWGFARCSMLCACRHAALLPAIPSRPLVSGAAHLSTDSNTTRSAADHCAASGPAEHAHAKAATPCAPSDRNVRVIGVDFWRLVQR